MSAIFGMDVHPALLVNSVELFSGVGLAGKGGKGNYHDNVSERCVGGLIYELLEEFEISPRANGIGTSHRYEVGFIAFGL